MEVLEANVATIMGSNFGARRDGRPACPFHSPADCAGRRRVRPRSASLATLPRSSGELQILLLMCAIQDGIPKYPSPSFLWAKPLTSFAGHCRCYAILSQRAACPAFSFPADRSTTSSLNPLQTKGPCRCETVMSPTGHRLQKFVS